MSRMTFRKPPGVSAPAPPKKTVHWGSVIAFSRTDAQVPRVLAWNEMRLYPSTRSATVSVFIRSRCSIGTAVSSALVGFFPAIATSGRTYVLAREKLAVRSVLLFLRPRADGVLVAVPEHVQVGVLALELLDPLHNILQCDR